MTSLRAVFFLVCVIVHSSDSAAQLIWNSPLIASGRTSVFAYAERDDGGSYVGQRHPSRSGVRIVSLTRSGAVEWDRWIQSISSQTALANLTLRARAAGGVLVHAGCAIALDSFGEVIRDGCIDAAPATSADAPATFDLPDGGILSMLSSQPLTRLGADASISWISNSADFANGPGAAPVTGVLAGGKFMQLTSTRFRVWDIDTGRVLVNRARGCDADCFVRPSLGNASGGVSPLLDGSFVTLGTSHSLERYSPDGALIWRKPAVFSQEPANFASVAPLGNDETLVAFSNGTLFKFDSAGNIVWRRSHPREFSSIKRLDDGNVVLSTRLKNAVEVDIRIESFRVERTTGALTPIATTDSLPGGSDIERQLFVGARTSLLTAGARLGVVDGSGALRWQRDDLLEEIRSGSGLEIACRNNVVEIDRPSRWWLPGPWMSVDDQSGVAELAASGNGSNPCGFPIASNGDIVRIMSIEPDGLVLQRAGVNGEVRWTQRVNAGVRPSGTPRTRSSILRTPDGHFFFIASGTYGSVTTEGQVVFARHLVATVPDQYDSDVYLTNVADGTVALVQPDMVQHITTAGQITREFRRPSYPHCAMLLVAGASHSVSPSSCASLYATDINGIETSLSIASGDEHYLSFEKDQSGDVFAIVAKRQPYTYTLRGVEIRKWLSSGAIAWTWVDPVLSKCATCSFGLVAMVPDGAGGAYALVNVLSGSNASSHLLHVNQNGVEVARYRSALLRDGIATARLRKGDEGTLLAIMLRDGADARSGLRSEVRKFRLQPVTDASRVEVSLVTAGETPIQLGDPLRVRANLVTSSGVPKLAPVALNVYFGIESTIVDVRGQPRCRIEVGQSSCEPIAMFARRIDNVSGGVDEARVWVSAEGYPVGFSQVVRFSAAQIRSDLRLVGVGSPLAYSWQRIELTIKSTTPGALAPVVGPTIFAGGEPLPFCSEIRSSIDAARFSCNWIARTSKTPLRASVSADNANYVAPSDALLVPAVTPIRPRTELQLSEGNTYAAGEPVTVFVELFAPSGINVSPYVPAGALKLNGVDCDNAEAAGTLETQHEGSRIVCRVTPLVTGPYALTLDFGGGNDLLSFTEQRGVINIQPRAQVSGVGPAAATAQICSTNPAVSCQILADGTWSCVGAQGFSTDVYFRSRGNVLGYFTNTPKIISNQVGFSTSVAPVIFRPASGTCTLDFNGDGAVNALTDGILSSPSANHRCAYPNDPVIADARSRYSVFPPLTAFDVIWGGPHTTYTRLVTLRIMFGFSVEAAVADVPAEYLAVTPIHRIREIFGTECGFP